jgi:MFS family permease
LFLLTHYGIRGVFWAAAVPGALAVLVAWFGIRETLIRKTTIRERKIREKMKSHVSQNRRDMGHPPQLGQPPDMGHPSQNSASAEQSSHTLPGSFYFVLIAVTLFSLGNSSDMFLVMRAQNVGISVKLAPLLGLVFNITYTLGSWPAGWLSDRFSRHDVSKLGISRKWIAAAGYLIFAGVYFVFGLAPSTLAIWIAMAIYGLYYALTQPVLKALVVETASQEIRGRALGIYFFATSVAALGASLITGILWKHYGAGVPFYLSAGMALASAVMLLGTR